MTLGSGIFQSLQANQTLRAEMLQGLHILQLTSAELHSFIQEQLGQNPMLEEQNSSVFSSLTEFRGASSYYAGEAYLEAVPDPQGSLEEVLLEQLHCSSALPPSARRIATYIIGNLTDSGYLPLSPSEIAAELGVHLDAVNKALDVVRRFEPSGIAAESLSQCLLAQLIQRKPRNPLAERLVEHHLQELAGGGRSGLAGKLRVSPSAILEALGVIRGLNPRPGSSFSKEKSNYILSDLSVRKTECGFEAVIRDSLYPKLYINRHYGRLLQERSASPDELAYFKQHLHAAKGLIHSISQRHSTLRKVAQAMLDRQTSYLTCGAGHILPMTMKEIAEDTGLHESTVSRAVNGKYIMLPWGITELKSLFSGSATSAGGISQEAVKALIKSWIQAENRKKPYSDQQLADRLAIEGVKVARRTVSKYREELGIIASSLRQA